MSNYTNLVQDIKDFTENNGTDFANEINRFIANVELRLSKELINCPALNKHVTSSLTASDPFIKRYGKIFCKLGRNLLYCCAYS